MTPKYYYDVVQSSEEWLKMRLGVITASDVSKLFAKQPDVHTLYSRGGDTYIADKVFEIIFQELKYFRSDATDWGKDHEEEARKAYEAETNTKVKEVGFVMLDDGIGCSPDGLVDADGLVEIKCPYNSKVHLDNIKRGGADKKYKFQMLHQLYVTRRKWVDFYSYDPRQPIENISFRRRYTLDELWVDLGECKEMYETRIFQTRYQIRLGVKVAEKVLEHVKTATITIDGEETETEIW